jgi:hypothetical protein
MELGTFKRVNDLVRRRDDHGIPITQDELSAAFRGTRRPWSARPDRLRKNRDAILGGAIEGRVEIIGNQPGRRVAVLSEDTLVTILETAAGTLTFGDALKIFGSDLGENTSHGAVTPSPNDPGSPHSRPPSDKDPPSP